MRYRTNNHSAKTPPEAGKQGVQQRNATLFWRIAGMLYGISILCAATATLIETAAVGFPDGYRSPWHRAVLLPLQTAASLWALSGVLLCVAALRLSPANLRKFLTWHLAVSTVMLLLVFLIVMLAPNDSGQGG